MPLLRRFIEIQSDLRCEAISTHTPTETPVFKLDVVQSTHVDTPSFSVMTYNVCPISILLNDGSLQGSDQHLKSANHFKWKKRRDSFMKELKQYQPDILCLQEIQTWKDNGHWADLLLDLGYDYDVYCPSKPRPTLSYQSNGFNRNFYGQAIAWKKNKFRRVAYEPFFFDKAPQSHPTDITPFTGAMIQFSMLEYLYEPPPLQQTPLNKNQKESVIPECELEVDYFDDVYCDEDGFEDEENDLKLTSNDGDCISAACATYPFKVKNTYSMPRFAIFVVNTKFLDLKGFDYERLRMFYVLLSQLELFQAIHQPLFCKATKSIPSNFPHVICGDFGFSPSSLIYQKLLQKKIDPSLMAPFERSEKDAIQRAHRLGFNETPMPWFPSQTNTMSSSSRDGRYESPRNGFAKSSPHFSPLSFFPLDLVPSSFMGSMDVAPRNKLPLKLLMESIDELAYRFQFYSAYRGYEFLNECHEMEQKILTLRKKTNEKNIQREWAPIGSETHAWGNSSSTWGSEPTNAWSTSMHSSGGWGNNSSSAWGSEPTNDWSTSMPSNLGWGNSSSNNEIPFKPEPEKNLEKPIYPNESVDVDIDRLKRELKKIAIIDQMAEEDSYSGEPSFSCFMDSRLESSDFIFYSSIHSRSVEKKKLYSSDNESRFELFPTHILSMPNKAEVEKGIPNDVFPSDHICLVAKFNVHIKSK
ncbi:hypothetical protein HMI54_001253 [Coelomomyces lativittatus]|nr:hypothetical protein HMI56_000605 [Coelomomyces lativittatus]KAJ1515229.1 hypothetical protein HMI55_003910 [Coelomomyces lativittatus]KAJ1518340.1 hypothetical protein HMI54_001253 [Coelomomyces lativittatus]